MPSEDFYGGYNLVNASTRFSSMVHGDELLIWAAIVRVVVILSDVNVMIIRPANCTLCGGELQSVVTAMPNVYIHARASSNIDYRRRQLALIKMIAIFGVLKQATFDFFEDNAPRHGAAIAYYTLFALAPLLLLVIAVAGFVVGRDVVRSELIAQIAGLLGRDGADAVQAILERANKPRDGIAATLLGLSGLIFAGTGAFLELQAALNMIWRVRSETNAGFDIRRLLKRRLVSLGVVVLIGFFLLVSLSISAAMQIFTGWLQALMPGVPLLIMIINQTLSLVITTALFGLLFRVLPDVHLRWRDVSVGAFVTAILFAVGQFLIGLYLGKSALASPFGAAGTVAIILVWVYYSTQIVLFGAEFTRVYMERFGKPLRPMDGAVRADALAT